MQVLITRIALFQLLAAFYCKVGVGLILKVVWKGMAPPMLATDIRDYGSLLFLLPLVWLVWASVVANRPRVGTGDLPPILISGLALLGGITLLAAMGTVSAGGGDTIIKLDPPSHSSNAVQ